LLLTVQIAAGVPIGSYFDDVGRTFNGPVETAG